MRTLLRNFFISHWQRKLLSLVLAVIIWLVVSHSLTGTRIIGNIGVRIINLPPGKTVEGVQPNGFLSKRISLTLSGNRNVLDQLTANDLEVVIDVGDAQNEFVASIQKKNLLSLNPEIDLATGITRVSSPNFLIRPMRLVTEKIPIVVTSPIGEAPRGYQFLDIFPYRLYVTVSGPEKIIKRLKDREIRLTFNLNEITRAQLDTLTNTQGNTQEKNSNDEVCFLVPDTWKQINIPSLSDTPITIDDPDAKLLRIDFTRRELLTLDTPLPVALFYPPEFVSTINPNTLKLIPGGILQDFYGTCMISQPLAVKGVSRLFLDVVKEMMQIVIIAEPVRDQSALQWSLEFVDHRRLEDEYVNLLSSESMDEDLTNMQTDLREEYLRNRFRSYMTRLQLYKPNDTRFDLKATLQGDKVKVEQGGGKS